MSLEIKHFLVVGSKQGFIAAITVVAIVNLTVDVVFLFGVLKQSSSFSKTLSPELQNAVFFIASILVRLHQFGNDRDVVALVTAEGTTVVTVRAPGQVSVEVALSG